MYKGKFLSAEAYFKHWVQAHVNRMSPKDKKSAYKKYAMRYQVFNRDGFVCQNVVKKEENGVISFSPCQFCNGEKYYEALTVHHVKSKRNGGNDSARNGITICQTIHRHYEQGKGPLTVSKNDSVPDWMKGHTYKLSDCKKKVVRKTMNWKKTKAKWRAFRKNLRVKRLNLNLDQLSVLMKFLEFNFAE